MFLLLCLLNEKSESTLSDRAKWWAGMQDTCELYVHRAGRLENMKCIFTCSRNLNSVYFFGVD